VTRSHQSDGHIYNNQCQRLKFDKAQPSYM
jgi:hypothetical protein